MANKKFLVDIDLNKNQLLNAVIQVLATAPGSPTAGQIYYSSATNSFYGWTGSGWLDLGSQGVGNTNLTFSRDGTTVTVESSTGFDAILPAATTSLAGVQSAADKTKLDGIDTGATKNQTDAYLRDRANHTGTQLAATISDIQTTITNNVAVLANTAKVTNATHTGEVTGSGALTITAKAVTNAKLADVATKTFKGRNSAGTGVVEDMSVAQVRTNLSIDQVDNTSDANKPLSSAATIALALKVDKNGSKVLSDVDFTFAKDSKLTGIEPGATADQDADEVPFDNTTTGFTATDVQAAIDELKAYTDSSTVGGLVYIGGYNASTNTPDLDVSPSGVKKGHTYTVTVGGNFFSEGVQAGDMLISTKNNPAVIGDWTVVNKNIPDIVDASESNKGLVEEATDGEVTAGTATGGTGAKLFITPAKLKTFLGLDVGTKTVATKYTETIGNGSNTTIIIQHDIGSTFNTVQVYETASPYSEVVCHVESVDASKSKLIFNVAPANNQYTVVVVG